jgi:hypothetical protein
LVQRSLPPRPFLSPHPDESNFFEGVAIFLSDTSVTIDFGDGDDAPPSTFLLSDVQRVAAALTLEVDDLVECGRASEGGALKYRGRVDSINADGTLNVKFDCSDEEQDDDFEMDVDPGMVRKLGSGRSSARKKFKKAVNAVLANIKFVKGGKSFSDAQSLSDAESQGLEGGGGAENVDELDSGEFGDPEDP